MKRSPPVVIVLSWIALLLLTGTTLGIAFLPFGAGNLIAQLLISAAQATIVVGLFMKLPRAPALAWVFAGAGLFWLMIMFGLSSVDYATRAGITGS